MEFQRVPVHLLERNITEKENNSLGTKHSLISGNNMKIKYTGDQRIIKYKYSIFIGFDLLTFFFQ